MMKNCEGRECNPSPTFSTNCVSLRLFLDHCTRERLTLRILAPPPRFLPRRKPYTGSSKVVVPSDSRLRATPETRSEPVHQRSVQSLQRCAKGNEMRFRTKILNHFCRGCGTLLSADERQTGLCSSCWFEKEKKQSLDDKDWQEELLRELDGYQPMAGR